MKRDTSTYHDRNRWFGLANSLAFFSRYDELTAGTTLRKPKISLCILTMVPKKKKITFPIFKILSLLTFLVMLPSLVVVLSLSLRAVEPGM